MNIFKKSRTEDSVDYINFWTVLIFLVLSLITWLPLSRQQSVSNFSTSCWSPAHFKESQANFVNAYCGGAFLDVLLKRNKTQILDSPLDDQPFHPPVKYTPRKVDKSEKVIPANSSSDPTESALTEQVNPVNYLSLSLFLIAICLAAIRLLSNILLTFSGVVNVDRALISAIKAQALDESSRRRVLQNIAHTAVQDTKPKPRVMSTIYLASKCLNCCILFAAVLCLSMIQNETKLNDFQANANDLAPGDLDFPTVKFYTCRLVIKQFNAYHKFTLHCVSTPKTNIAGPEVLHGNKEYTDILSKLAILYLTIIFLINILGLITWICRLTLKRCLPPYVTSDVSLDFRLLLLISCDNAGPGVTTNLVKAINVLSGGLESRELTGGPSGVPLVD